MTGLWWSFNLALSHIGMGFEWVLVFFAAIAALPFFAKDFKIGVISLLATYSGLFIWFYEKSFNWKLPLVMVFISIILLAISLFGVQSTSTTGGFN